MTPSRPPRHGRDNGPYSAEGVQHGLDAAKALAKAGRLQEAARELEILLARVPEHPEVHHYFGLVQHKLGDNRLALLHLKKAVSQQSGNSAVNYNIGVVYQQEAHYGEAIPHFLKAIEISPDWAMALNNLAACYEAIGDNTAAESAYSRALEQDPNCAEALTNLGRILTIQGNKKLGNEYLRRAVELNPQSSVAQFVLAEASQAESDSARVEQIIDVLKTAKLSTKERVTLHHTLAKILDDTGQYDQAFQQLQQAHALKMEPYDIDAFRASIDEVIQTFDDTYFMARRGMGSESARPIFIVGMPRSGTSLTEQTLASHRDVAGAGELKLISALAEAIAPAMKIHEPYPSSARSMNADTAAELARAYVEFLGQQSATAHRVTDKMPFNFLHLGLIASLFPNAHIVHCRRDPADTCLSIYFQNFAEPLPFASDLRTLGLYYLEYQRLMDHWRRVLPMRMFEMDYETLLNDQQQVTRRLVHHCGLEWDPNCLQFHKNSRDVRTASRYQVRQPLYRSSMQRWRRYRRHLGPLLETLGLEP